jgi:hypothetical protein
MTVQTLKIKATNLTPRNWFLIQQQLNTLHKLNTKCLFYNQILQLLQIVSAESKDSWAQSDQTRSTVVKGGIGE